MGLVVFNGFKTLIVFVAFFPTVGLAQDFNNESVIALSQAGLGEDVLLAKIDSLPCSYDVSTDAIIGLANAGVPNSVIAAMVDRCVGSTKAQGSVTEASDPSVKRAPGIYLDFGTDDDHDLRQIRPTTASGGKVTGNGSILFPFTAKLGMAGPAARTTPPTSSPDFYFYFETSDARVSDFGVSPTIAAQSPSEFTLVKFKVKNGQREMVVGKANMFNSTIGIDSKNAIPFSIEEIGDSIFKATPQSELAPGEYGFILRAGGDSYRIFDFSISG